jgi:hypothetical protein
MDMEPNMTCVRSPSDNPLRSIDPGAVFDDALVSSTTETLAGCGITLHHLPWQPVDPVQYENGAFLAFIGFFSDTMKGTLLVAFPDRLVREVSATQRPPATTELARLDLVAELMNLSLGKIKNRLARFGLVLHAGIPKAIRCLELRMLTELSPTHRGHRFASEAGDLQAWFDAVLSPGFALHPPEADDPSAKEGELLMF